MARRNDHSRDELRELILEASWGIIKTSGTKGLSMRKIADAISYAPGTIYNIFQSMDDVVLHINAHTLDKLYLSIQNDLKAAASQSPEDTILTISQTYMDFVRDYDQFWALLFEYSFQEDFEIETWYQDKIDQLFLEIETIITPLLEGKSPEERRMATRLFWSSLHGLSSLYHSGKLDIIASDIPEKKMREYLIKTLIHGVST